MTFTIGDYITWLILATIIAVLGSMAFRPLAFDLHDCTITPRQGQMQIESCFLTGTVYCGLDEHCTTNGRMTVVCKGEALHEPHPGRFDINCSASTSSSPTP